MSWIGTYEEFEDRMSGGVSVNLFPGQIKECLTVFMIPELGRAWYANICL